MFSVNFRIHFHFTRHQSLLFNSVQSPSFWISDSFLMVRGLWLELFEMSKFTFPSPYFMPSFPSFSLSLLFLLVLSFLLSCLYSCHSLFFSIFSSLPPSTPFLFLFYFFLFFFSCLPLPCFLASFFPLICLSFKTFLCSSLLCLFLPFNIFKDFTVLILAPNSTQSASVSCSYHHSQGACLMHRLQLSLIQFNTQRPWAHCRSTAKILIENEGKTQGLDISTLCECPMGHTDLELLLPAGSRSLWVLPPSLVQFCFLPLLPIRDP